MGKTTSRVLAGAVLAASLTGFGAGIASAHNPYGAGESSIPTIIDIPTTTEYGPVPPNDDFRRGGQGLS